MRRLVLVLLALSVLTVTATAQDFPRATLFGGYSYSRVQISSAIARNFNGWNAEGTFNANRYLGITADVSGHYHSESGVSSNIYHFLFGPQVTYHSKDSKVTPYGRFLFGGSRAGAGLGSLSASQTKWSYLFGGGVDVKVTPVFAIRVIQADYIRTHFADDHQNNLRLSFGIALNVGGK